MAPRPIIQVQGSSQASEAPTTGYRSTTRRALLLPGLLLGVGLGGFVDGIVLHQLLQ
jgi:hypothetical protein